MLFVCGYALSNAGVYCVWKCEIKCIAYKVLLLYGVCEDNNNKAFCKDDTLL